MTTQFKKMPLFMGIFLLVCLAACSSPDRSRALGDETIAATTIALQVCSNCHGMQGVSTSPNFPNIAAQSKQYFVDQMKSFRSHGRSDPAGFEYMWGVSARLTDEQIDGLATFFSAQTPPPNKTQETIASKIGQTIFEKGIESNNTPACTGCHGAKGEGMLQFPRVAGQHADYTIKQLLVFQRTDQRPEGSVMKTIAHGLTSENIQNIAAYLEAIP